MCTSEQSRAITYFQENVEQVLSEITASRAPMLITQDGKPVFVIQDIVSYEKAQETLALLKILALGRQQIAAGEVSSAEAVFAELDAEDEAKHE